LQSLLCFACLFAFQRLSVAQVTSVNESAPQSYALKVR
jgi:hypothetical protein